MKNQDLAAGQGISVHAGFPNPATDQGSRQRPLALDLNSLLIKHPSSTYLFRVSGHSWASMGIYDGDIAVIDRQLAPRQTDTVIVWQSSGFALRRQADVMPDEIPWGIVTATVHQVRPV